MDENTRKLQDVSVLDPEFEEQNSKWEALDPEVQKQRLAKVIESFGVGGP